MKLPTDYVAGTVYSEHKRMQTVNSPYFVRDCARCSDGTSKGISFSTLDKHRRLCNECST